MMGAFRPSPILSGGGSGGGGGDGLALVTITGTTGSIDGSDASNLDIALPAGVTRCTIMSATLTLVGGTSTSASVEVFPTDARSSGDKVCVFGNAFAGVTLAGVDEPFFGPWNTTGGNISTAAMAYNNAEADEFVRVVVHNRHFEDTGAYRVDLEILPIGA